jgi:cytochrome oxidase Cu insertion factor (SCO1/SenC/PrrC family)
MKKNVKWILLVAALMAASSAIGFAQGAKNRTEPLKVGEVAPDFTLLDQNGKSLTLSKLGEPVVLVFYRGFW